MEYDNQKWPQRGADLLQCSYKIWSSDLKCSRMESIYGRPVFFKAADCRRLDNLEAIFRAGSQIPNMLETDKDVWTGRS